MLELVITESFTTHRRKFLDKHLGNKFLDSLIKRLERKLIEIEVQPGTRWGQYNLPTPFIGKAYKRLGCVYVIKADASSISPCLLYFPYMQASTNWPDSTVFSQMAKVLSELGW